MPEKIEITFLGTSDSIPTEKRNHTAVLLRWGAENILMDCGEGTQRQFRIAGINPCKLTRILLTHWHGDHIFGLPGLLSTLAMSGYSRKLEIYGPRGTKENLRGLEALYGRFGVEFSVVEVGNGRFFEDKEIALESAEMDHNGPTVAYSFIVKDKLRLDKKKIKKLKIPNSPLLGKLQKGEDVVFEGKKVKAKDVTYLQKGNKAAFVIDTAKNKNAVMLAKDSDILICEATFLSDEEDKAKEYKHLTAAQAGEIAKSAKVDKLYLTHISQRYEHRQDKILKEAKKVFKDVKLAKDFDKFTVG
jgi:ribonuclease Z